MTRKKKRSSTTDSGRRKLSLSKVSLIIAIISLIIAAIGGVPGFLSIKNYLDKSSIRVIFDQNESLPCVIANSPSPALNGKFAILLYGVTIVGKGAQKFVAFDVNLSIRINGVWHEGVRFKPRQRQITDKNGWTGPAVQVHVGIEKPSEAQRKKDIGSTVSVGETLNILDWRDFEPRISVGFAEPSTFMVAAYFPTATLGCQNADKLRIFVRDYLGNAYKEETGTAGLRKPTSVLFLDQSPI